MKRLEASFHFMKWPAQRALSAHGLRDSCLMTDFPSRTRRTGNAGKRSDAMTASSAWVPSGGRRKPPLSNFQVKWRAEENWNETSSAPLNRKPSREWNFVVRPIRHNEQDASEPDMQLMIFRGSRQH